MAYWIHAVLFAPGVQATKVLISNFLACFCFEEPCRVSSTPEQRSAALRWIGNLSVLEERSHLRIASQLAIDVTSPDFLHVETLSFGNLVFSRVRCFM